MRCMIQDFLRTEITAISTTTVSSPDKSCWRIGIMWISPGSHNQQYLKLYEVAGLQHIQDRLLISLD